MAQAVCKKDCWDSEKALFYSHGKTYEIKPDDPIARHFRFVDGAEPEPVKVEKLVDLGGRAEIVEEVVEEKKPRGNPNWLPKKNKDAQESQQSAG
jgi:hypothetical protein